MTRLCAPLRGSSTGIARGSLTRAPRPAALPGSAGGRRAPVFVAGFVGGLAGVLADVGVVAGFAAAGFAIAGLVAAADPDFAAWSSSVAFTAVPFTLAVSV